MPPSLPHDILVPSALMERRWGTACERLLKTLASPELLGKASDNPVAALIDTAHQKLWCSEIAGDVGLALDVLNLLECKARASDLKPSIASFRQIFLCLEVARAGLGGYSRFHALLASRTTRALGSPASPVDVDNVLSWVEVCLGPFGPVGGSALRDLVEQLWGSKTQEARAVLERVQLTALLVFERVKKQREGVIGDLRMEIVSGGTGEIIADRRRMPFLQLDADFERSVAAGVAWAKSLLLEDTEREQVDFRWSLDPRLENKEAREDFVVLTQASRKHDFVGGSAGALFAFAAAWLIAARRESSPRCGRRPGFRPTTRAAASSLRLVDQLQSIAPEKICMSASFAGGVLSPIVALEPKLAALQTECPHISLVIVAEHQLFPPIARPKVKECATITHAIAQSAKWQSAERSRSFDRAILSILALAFVLTCAAVFLWGKTQVVPFNASRITLVQPRTDIVLENATLLRRMDTEVSSVFIEPKGGGSRRQLKPKTPGSLVLEAPGGVGPSLIFRDAGTGTCNLQLSVPGDSEGRSLDVTPTNADNIVGCSYTARIATTADVRLTDVASRGAPDLIVPAGTVITLVGAEGASARLRYDATGAIALLSSPTDIPVEGINAALNAHVELPESSCRGGANDELSLSEEYHGDLYIGALTLFHDELGVTVGGRWWSGDVNGECQGPRWVYWTWTSLTCFFLLLAVLLRPRFLDRCLLGGRRARLAALLVVCTATAGCGAASTQPPRPSSTALPGANVVVTDASACPDSGGSLALYQQTIGSAAESTYRRLATPMRALGDPDKETLSKALEGNEGWLFLFYSGHGRRVGDGGSEVCLGGPEKAQWTSVDELLSSLPSSLRGAVVVLNACSSAYVDARLARERQLPLSVISASPYVIDKTALFGEAVLQALESVDDENCDGAITDEELFHELQLVLRRKFPLATHEAFPKLRRQAPSPIPLPVPVRPDERCERIRARVVAMVEGDARWSALRAPLKAQLALATGSAALPRLDVDYFVLNSSADADPGQVAAIRSAALASGLSEVVDGDLAKIRELASVVSFADFFQLDIDWNWLRVTRLRDGSRQATRPLEEAASVLPNRCTVSRRFGLEESRMARYDVATTSGTTMALRFVREAGRDRSDPVPCYEVEGQCFLAPEAERCTR